MIEKQRQMENDYEREMIYAEINEQDRLDREKIEQ